MEEIEIQKVKTPDEMKNKRNIKVPRDLLKLPFKEGKRIWADVFEAQYLKKALEKHNGNISKTARASGINRRTIQRLMEKID